MQCNGMHFRARGVVVKVTVTTKDIALIAGVSQSTVSRSLNDSPLISEETKQLIKKNSKGAGIPI